MKDFNDYQNRMAELIKALRETPRDEWLSHPKIKAISDTVRLDPEEYHFLMSLGIQGLLNAGHHAAAYVISETLNYIQSGDYEMIYDTADFLQEQKEV